MIERVTVYRTMGKQFDTLDKAIGYRFDRVGEFFDKSQDFVVLSPKDRLNLVEFIVENRRELISLLNYDDKPKDDDIDRPRF